ncbi:unnamed protein product [Boreogadus saida]
MLHASYVRLDYHQSMEHVPSHLLPRHWSFGHPAVSCVPGLVPVLVPAASPLWHKEGKARQQSTTLKNNNTLKSAGLEHVLNDRQGSVPN